MSPKGTGLLEVDNLETRFASGRGEVRAVDGLSFRLEAGRVLCIVGESGSGKSVTARSVMRLVQPPGRIAGGSIRLGGQDLLALSEREMRALRGDRLAMIFQNPLTALNPGLTVGEQVAEGLILHRGMDRRSARREAMELLRKVGTPAAEERLDEYPARFSGGMRQRILIAAAIACGPELLIADEPTTALDVTMQAQILRLLKTLQAETGSGLIMITHDLGVVAAIADEVLVMYAGRAVEQGPVETIFEDPRHPYTIGLIETAQALEDVERPIVPIPGSPPVTLGERIGCAFAPRCRFAEARCRNEVPPLEALAADHRVACHVKPEGGLA